MEYLDCDDQFLDSKGAIHTAREISRQPELWLETYRKIVQEKNDIRLFLKKVLSQECPYVILTGAGTSAFIGEALVGPFQKKWGVSTRAIATTDIITHPHDYFLPSRPTLLISFARSGDSPESLATLDLASQICPEFFNLTITCNKEGELARRAGDPNTYVFLLPEETNDQSLAMTSSFTSMLLAGLLLLDIETIDRIAPVVNTLAECGTHLLRHYTDRLRNLAETGFQRMVFLGSGPLFGTAHESHLKVQELSDGIIICTFDSFLGFRHGPKAVVNASTAIVYLLSNNAFVRKYEIDLIKSVNVTAAGQQSIAVGNHIDAESLNIHLPVSFPDALDAVPEEFLSVLFVMPAQILGFFKSLYLGLSPDSPSSNGSITRVVQGVTIYPGIRNEAETALGL